jgi:peptidoglycan hydrolase-like protein with peptidoglycan-binding domain
MRRRTLAAIGIPLAAVLIAGTVVAVVWQPWRDENPQTAAEKPATVVAERTTLTSNLLLNADLTFGEDVDLPGRSGTITWLPDSGTVVAIGQSLYEVDGRPVIAVAGSRPFWRELRQGMSDGPDVAQLEQALADLGYGAGVTVDDHFTAATATAVKKWQRALGLERTGSIALGDLVAINAASVRIAAVTAQLGDQAQGSPMSYTSTTIRAIADLTDAQARELVAPIEVTVRLPDGTEVPATITAIDPGGEPTGEGDETTSASAIIEFADQALIDDVGLRSVKVTIARDEVADALVVPVTALIATLDGGYAVDVVRSGDVVRVPVQLGLIADTRVQITGGDLDEGDEVVVAA